MGSSRGTGPARIVVLGDLMLDVVLAPARALETGTDVPGRVALVQGGSAANTARWLGRLGARTSLIAAVGRDATGRALVEAVRSDGVTPLVARRRRPDRADRGLRGARRRAQLRGRSRCRRPPRTDDLRARLVRRRGRAPPAGLLAPRGTPRPCGPAGDRTGTRRRRVGERGSRLDRTAAGRWPASRAGAHRRDRAGLPVRDGDRGRGPPRRARGRRIARLRRDGGRQARREGRDRPDPGRPGAGALRGRDGAHRGRPIRPAPATPSTPGSSSAGSPRGPPAGRCRRRSSGRPWPATAPRRGSCRRPGPNCTSGRPARRDAGYPVPHHDQRSPIDSTSAPRSRPRSRTAGPWSRSSRR